MRHGSLSASSLDLGGIWPLFRRLCSRSCGCGRLKNRDRIDRCPRASDDPCRRDDQQELPSIECGSGLGKRLEIQIVENMQPERRQSDAVDGIRETRNRCTSVLIRVAAEDSNVALLQE